MANDTISRKATIDAMEDVDWYHINKDGQLTHGANSEEDEPLYKAEDVYKVLNDMPTAQPDVPDTNVGDMISRQAAIDKLETVGYDFSNSGLSEIELEEVCEAVGDVRQDMISMIKRLPSAQPVAKDTNVPINVNDCISRQAAIDFIDAGHLCNPNEPRWSDNEVVNFLKSRPSAQPETHEKRTETHSCDCISRQAAIRWVKTECNPYGKPTLDFESGKKVIEHLKQMPSAEADSKELSFTHKALDTINRQAAIDALDKHLRTTDVPVSYPGIISALTEWLNELPPSQSDLSGYSDKLWKKAYERGKAEALAQLEEAYISGETEAEARFHAQQRWIPCSEKLPEANGRYLVTRGLVAAGALWDRVYIANYSNLMGIKSVKIWWQGNVGKSDFERLDDVLAWMPLPETYREGE